MCSIRALSRRRRKGARMADDRIPTIAEAGRGFRDGSLSPVEVTESCLARIEAQDSEIHSFIEVTAERAMDAARRAETELRQGIDRGPLHGIPYGLKDIFDAEGLRTTAHSKILVDNLAAADSEVQRRIADGGGVLLGKQALWEFTYGGPSFDLPWPPARNPWDLSRTQMGSSTGSAAAIAAGFCLGAMGSDTGGSIRTPAAACGVAGLKPTYGLVSRRGVLPNTFSFDHCGPMAWTVEDCALMLGVIAGHDPADPGSIAAPATDYSGGLDTPVAGTRIGVVRGWYEEEPACIPAVKAAMDEAVKIFEALDCTVQDVALPGLDDFLDCKNPISLAELYAIHEEGLTTRPLDYGHSFRFRVMPGALIRASDYVQAMRWRGELTRTMLAAYEEVDVLIVPAAFDVAPPMAPDEPPTRLNETVPSLTTPFNLAGNPALALCMGFSAEGLPLGLQIAGRLFDEALVLRLGHSFERATDFRSRRPVAGA